MRRNVGAVALMIAAILCTGPESRGMRAVGGVNCTVPGTKSVRCSDTPGQSCPIQNTYTKCQTPGGGFTNTMICMDGNGILNCKDSRCLPANDAATDKNCVQN